jgi:hypothetical protein
MPVLSTSPCRLAALVALAAACKEPPTREAPAPAPVSVGADAAAAAPAAPAPTEVAPFAAPFAAWDRAGRAAAWRGAWLVPGAALGSTVAWNVLGDKVVVFDGLGEDTLDFTLESPCTARVTRRDADGTVTMYTKFAMKDGAIVPGLADGGARRGGEAVACVADGVFVLDAAGVCAFWRKDRAAADAWVSTAATCALRRDGNREVFAYVLDGRSLTLRVDGDGLLSEQLAQVHGEKVADFETAKARIRAP